MAKKKENKKKNQKTDYKKKYKALKAKYKKLKSKYSEKSKKKVNKPNKLFSDNSSNYNSKEAILKLRTLMSVENLTTFSKGETRVTVLKALQGRINVVSK